MTLREKVARELFKWSREDFEEITISDMDAELEWWDMDADGREGWYIRADRLDALVKEETPCPK